MPIFDELLVKIANNETLTPLELENFRQEAKALGEIKNLVKGWVIPGSGIPFIRNLKAENIFIPTGELQLGTPAPGQGFSGVRIGQPAFEYAGELWNIAGISNDVLQFGIRASDGKLVFGGGDGHLDEFGLTFQNQEGFVQFLDTLGNGTMQIHSDGDNFLVLKNAYGGKGLTLLIDSAAHNVMQFDFTEDGSLAERSLFQIFANNKGSRLDVGSEIFIDGEGAGGGQTAITAFPSSATPSTPSQSNEVSIYLKSNKLIFQYNDTGTTRYKYLDLTGTGVTWVHSTTPP